MKVSLWIATAFFFLFGSVSALHIQFEHEAPNEFTFTFSSLKSSASTHFPNAHVVIYSGKYDVKMNETGESDIYDTDTGTCPAPLADYNNTINTRINLTKSPKCTLNILVRVGDVLDDKWSQANGEFKGRPIVLKVGCNKAKFEVPTYNNSQSISHAFTWGDTFVFIFLTLALGVTAYSVWFFKRLRRERHDYFDPYELELERQGQANGGK